MSRIKKRNKPFLDSLEEILDLTKNSEEVSVGQMIQILAGREYAALLIICSLPFCIPIQIPGLSTPFGILLVFLGVQIAFSQSTWWPDFILKKTIKSHVVTKLVTKTIGVVKFIQKFSHKRLLLLTQNPIFLRLNGLLVSILSIMLALPLPIPLTNMLSAFPILCFGLGLLEDDGVMIIIAYILFLVYIGFFTGLLIFGLRYIHTFF